MCAHLVADLPEEASQVVGGAVLAAVAVASVHRVAALEAWALMVLVE